MDRLFIKLLNEIENFIKLSEQAQHHLTESSIKNNSVAPAVREGWNEMVLKVKDRHRRIEILLQNGFKRHKDEIDQYLGTFRSLSRWFAEIACAWSISYKAIESSMNEIYSVLDEIDEKYNLGLYRDAGSDNVKIHYG